MRRAGFIKTERTIDVRIYPTFFNALNDRFHPTRNLFRFVPKVT